MRGSERELGTGSIILLSEDSHRSDLEMGNKSTIPSGHFGPVDFSEPELLSSLCVHTCSHLYIHVCVVVVVVIV